MRTHRLLLSKHSEHENPFETEEEKHKHQGHELIQDVKTVVLVRGVEA